MKLVIQKSIILLITVLLFSNCMGEKDKKGNAIGDFFPETINLSSEKIQTAPILYSTAGLLLMDSVVIALDLKAETIFQVLKLPQYDNVGGFINRGQGPEEEVFVDPYIQHIDGNQFMYKNFSSVKIVNFNTALNKLDLVEEIDLPLNLSELWYVIKLGDKIIGSKTDEPTSKEFISYDMITKEFIDFGPDFPIVEGGVKIDTTYNNSLFAKISTAKPDGSAFASVYDKFPILRIYSKDGGLKEDVRFQNGQSFPHALLEMQPSEYSIGEIMQNYRMIKSTDNFIYALYIGKKVKDLNAGLNDFSNEIHVWNWEGSPIMRILLDEKIFTFDVDKNDEFILCSSLETLDALYKYKLTITTRY